jgi:hypothetical protein
MINLPRLKLRGRFLGAGFALFIFIKILDYLFALLLFNALDVPFDALFFNTLAFEKGK